MTVTINLWYATSSDRCLHEAALDLLGLGRHLGVDRLLTGELHVELRAEVHGVEFYANGGQRAYIFRLVTTGSSTATVNAGNRGDPRWQAQSSPRIAWIDDARRLLNADQRIAEGIHELRRNNVVAQGLVSVADAFRQLQHEVALVQWLRDVNQAFSAAAQSSSLHAVHLFR